MMITIDIIAMMMSIVKMIIIARKTVIVKMIAI